MGRIGKNWKRFVGGLWLFTAFFLFLQVAAYPQHLASHHKALQAEGSHEKSHHASTGEEGCDFCQAYASTAFTPIATFAGVLQLNPFHRVICKTSLDRQDRQARIFSARAPPQYV